MTDLSKYSKSKVQGIPFYTNGNKGKDVMENVIKQCPKEKFVVAQTFEYIRTEEGRKTEEKIACKYGSVYEAEFNELIKTNLYIYDLMQTNEKYKHLRIVFDIDKEGEGVTDPLDGCIAVITDKFPDAILNISGSVAQTTKGTKYSYHIVLFNYVVEDVNEYELVQKLCVKHRAELGFDPSIYRMNGLYKCVNQSKSNKDVRIQAIISGSDNPLDHSLRCNIPTDPKTMADSTLKAEDFPDPEIVIKKRGRPKKIKLNEDGEPEKKI